MNRRNFLKATAAFIPAFVLGCTATSVSTEQPAEPLPAPVQQEQVQPAPEPEPTAYSYDSRKLWADNVIRGLQESGYFTHINLG